MLFDFLNSLSYNSIIPGTPSPNNFKCMFMFCWNNLGLKIGLKKKMTFGHWLKLKECFLFFNVAIISLYVYQYVSRSMQVYIIYTYINTVLWHSVLNVTFYLFSRRKKLNIHPLGLCVKIISENEFPQVDNTSSHRLKLICREGNPFQKPTQDEERKRRN